jgi:hypothetical protein
MSVGPVFLLLENAAIQAVEPPEDGQCAHENAGCPADAGWSVLRDAHARNNTASDESRNGIDVPA